MARVRDAGRWLGRLLMFNLLLLPRALRRSTGGDPFGGDPVGGVLLLPLGVLALLAVLLSTLDEVRVLFLYWWTDDVTPGTWGGPTMAGAWAVHAILGLVFFPVFLGVMAGIRSLARRVEADQSEDRPTAADGTGNVRRGPLEARTRRTRRWPIVLADIAALAFLVAFIAQL